MKEINIALVAHDGRKHELLEWVKFNWKMLAKYNIYATGTTGRLISELVIEEEGKLIRPFDKKVTRLFSGPLGGDQQIGAKIVEGKIDFVIFFSDPLTAAPHDPDVKALLRIAQVYDIPIANNKATADFLIHSSLMNESYDHNVINFNKSIAERAQNLPH